MSEEEVAEQLARFRAGMDQARAASQEVARGAAEFFNILVDNGVPPEFATPMAVEWIAQLMGAEVPEDDLP